MYIGQTKGTLQARLRGHYCTKYADHKKSAISQAVKLHGRSNFTAEVIIEVNSQEELNRLEVFYIEHFNTIAPNGYNLKAGGQTNNKLCQEVIDRIIAKNTGRKQTDKARDNISNAHKGIIYESARIKVIGTDISTGLEKVYGAMYLAESDGFDGGKIRLCCLGKRKQHKQWAWRFFGEPKKDLPKINTWKVAIVRICPNTGITKEYESAADAKREGFCHSKIIAVCKGKRKHTGGYLWRYKEI